jgi:histidine kinase-like protein
MRRMQAMTCLPTSSGADEPTWPFSSYLELGALPGAVPCARLHTKQMLWEWGIDEVTDTVELLVSETVTNAQRACAAFTGSRYRGRWTAGVPPVRLWLNADEGHVLIQVWDGDRRLPEPQSIDLDAESGRGLLLVETLSTEWGAHLLEGSSGKVVWAAVSRAEA